MDRQVGLSLVFFENTSPLNPVPWLFIEKLASDVCLCVCGCVKEGGEG